MTEQHLVDCDRCGGSGCIETIGCCGIYTENGECQQWCGIPVQEQCRWCGGCGQFLVDDDDD